ncbi:LysR substrate-binding domain-containing protein [Paraburkholderia dilworthii]|uniref:LysR substrate-binding domain-containing protein n=1 Tax=Paraburkholderia dilworthii TaxID=948106 RepID=UPI000424D1B7|nr:LysR substrate-binding domain-containing protein [Paraburkholderia dilworthii]
MALRLPSLQALHVFEAAARHLSLTRAALELNVTPVAVSRMVARLEDALGFKLFARTKTGLALTDEGAKLHVAVASGFGLVSDTINELKSQQEESETVTLSISSGFAAQWLLPRHQRFQSAFPSVNLRLQVMASRLYGPLDGADLGIRLHKPGSADDALCFCPELILAVCSPDYLTQYGPLDAPRHAGGHTLIHLEPTTHTWADYFDVTGIVNRASAKHVSYSDPGLALQAAMLGHGVMLGWLLAVAAPLNSGTVVPASQRIVETGCNYVLECRTREPSRVTREVAQWLIDEMRAELRRAEPVLASVEKVQSRAPV